MTNRDKSVVMLCVVLVLVGVSVWAVAAETIGYSGTIVFRSGKKVPYNHLGTQGCIGDPYVYGKHAGQQVTIRLSEIAEVIFAEADKLYTDGNTDSRYRGELTVVNRQGKRFTLQEAFIRLGKGAGKINYVYNDPITGKVRQGEDRIRDSVLSIVVGSEAGDLRKNPKTGEFFPSRYNFDPYTGDKLIWARSSTAGASGE